MLHIRKIKPEDIDFVIKLTSEKISTGDKLLSNIDNFLVCVSDNIKCGCGCMIPLKNKGFISWVVVSEGYRRKQLGGAIIKALLNIADLKGIDEVYAAGICGDFLKVMGFEEKNSSATMDEINEVLGDTGASGYFRVFLEGYFKPCSQK